MGIPVVRVLNLEVSEKPRSVPGSFLWACPQALIASKAEGDYPGFLLGHLCEKVKGEADFATIFQVSNL